MPPPTPTLPLIPPGHDEGGIRKRLPTLIEILYGLGIASGVEQVAPKIVEGLAEGKSFDWLLLWCSILAVFISIADWSAYALQERVYKSGGRLLADVFGVILLFFLFTSAYLPKVFLSVLVIYLWLAAAYPRIARKEYPSFKPYDFQDSRRQRAFVVTFFWSLAVFLPVEGEPRLLPIVALVFVTGYAITAFGHLAARLDEDLRAPESVRSAAEQ